MSRTPTSTPPAADPDSEMIWRCPACLGEMVNSDATLACTACGSSYEVIAGIPDLRFPKAEGESSMDDLKQARDIAAVAGKSSAEVLVRRFFSVREGVDGWTVSDTENRTRQSLEMPSRLRGEVSGWLGPLTDQERFLDLGCGFGGLLSAAASLGKSGLGIDNRMLVLVIAKRLTELSGRTATLACANAESLPLGDESIGGVVMYDVVEHVANLEKGLSEVSRVTKAGGMFACSTPNRFSLAPEPHVHLFGVGWLPRKFQAAYVKRRNGRDYTGTRLLSASELSRMMKRATGFELTVRVPPIPAGEVETASGVRRVLATFYNSVAQKRAFRGVFLRIGPFFQAVGKKN